MVPDSLTKKSMQLFIRIPIAALFLIVSSCEIARDNAASDPRSSADANWKLVQAYVDLDTAWHAKQSEIYSADDSDEERDRRLKEELGDHPDIVLAVQAARAIVATKGENLLEAAKFLVEHTRGLSPTESQDIELGLATLAAVIGPDWSVVEDFRTLHEAYQEKRQEISDSDLSSDEKRASFDELGEAPKGTLAKVAAIAVAEMGTAHERGREAAEFLVSPMSGAPDPESAIKGAAALAEHFPDYDNWHTILSWLEFTSGWDTSGQVKEFIADMAENSTNPVTRAIARGYAGEALMRDLNWSSIEADRRAELRTEALEYVTGLSLGVEDEAFKIGMKGDSEAVAYTFAEKEASLIHAIRHASVGGTVVDELGRRLDGSEENLSAYSGKVILVDFWATWCGPCVGALPELRELASAYPKDQFEILAISVDDEVETVLEFMDDEPMPWAQWHVGSESELAQTWHIRVYPTYVVVDQDGVILGRSSSLEEANGVIEQKLGQPNTQAVTES